MILLDKVYSGDVICDIDRDVCEAFYDSELPIDEHGFQTGQFRVHITWEPTE